MEECYICNFCRKLCKNGNSLRNHERLCKENYKVEIILYIDMRVSWVRSPLGPL